ncbi:hypothetical protein NJL88_25875 [Streptomyces sp. DK15]|uniref:hypothetical protein n=1 Tax=Streptomyces sp. DK15 TaxID=2957499 RepID=UPI0029ADFF34|nr:hypothetical protein [Streptomyces sp. DK15]MDX2393433.1 hypothetical protein [Streptomyces sp. DK15]
MSADKVVRVLSDADISRIADTLELKHTGKNSDFLIFETLGGGFTRQRDVAIPLAEAGEILDALNRGAERLKEYEGWVDPEKGFAEFEIRMLRLGAIRHSTVDRFTFESHPCAHGHSYSPPHEVVANNYYHVWRVTSPDGSICIELSPNSPLSVPLISLDLEGRGSRIESTLKVFLGGATGGGDLSNRAIGLANSFLFELNARNGTLYALKPRLQAHVRPRRAQSISHAVRFPKARVPKHVAALFAMASDARGGHTSSFLAYYQILEHYLPAAHKRDNVRKVRRILRSLDFDEEKDSSILKVLNSVDRAHGASEGEQLRTLVEECIPEDRLREFFELDHGTHFGKRGPISGVVAIHLNSGESLGSQVAKRVYALRNRIVHAKDDVRYAEASVLLPGGHEDVRLRPDVELLRVLAIEAIVDNQ